MPAYFLALLTLMQSVYLCFDSIPSLFDGLHFILANKVNDEHVMKVLKDQHNSGLNTYSTVKQ